MKLPPQAKKVFDGVIFDVYQWQQEMFDGSFETFEMLKRPNTVDTIATSGDKIFIQEQEQPTKPLFHSLIGGRQEEGETPLEAAKREMLEESGLTSDDWELYKTYEPYTKMEWEVYVFIARNCKKTAEQKLDAGEKIETKSLLFDEFLNMIESDKFCSREFAFEIMKMKQDKEKLEEFKKKLF